MRTQAGHLALSIADGRDREAIYAIRHDVYACELGQHPHTQRIHLFLAGPGGLALLLGHRWNRTRQSIVYEHLAVGRGYTTAFTIAG